MYIRRGHTEIHRDQVIVERFNRTLAGRLLGHQYAVEMLPPEGKRSTAWVKRLLEVVAALNKEITSLPSEKPAEAIKEKSVFAKASSTYRRPVGMKEKNAPLHRPRSLSLPARQAGGRHKKSHRSRLVFESLQHCKNGPKPRHAGDVLFSRRPQAQFREPRVACWLFRQTHSYPPPPPPPLPPTRLI